jgi:hypothetical protein
MFEQSARVTAFFEEADSFSFFERCARICQRASNQRKLSPCEFLLLLFYI